MVGFNFYPSSPRYVVPRVASELAHLLPKSVRTVAVCVDANDKTLSQIIECLKPDYVQAHGSESPARIQDIKQRFSVPVIKSLSVETAEDLEVVACYEGIADMLLFDARPPRQESALPGGNGLAFDWALLADFVSQIPWVLSGGLTPDNVDQAIRLTGASAVDVASGVEESPGQKSVALIQRFIRAARAADTEE